MQLPLFDERPPTDHAMLARCLAAPVVALDVETETRWPGWGPRHDFGLSYAAPVTLIGLAWREGDTVHTTVLAAPFDASLTDWLVTLFDGNRRIVAHNAVFDIRQLSRLTGGRYPARIWDTMVMARLIHPAPRLRYGLLRLADALGIAYSAAQAELKTQRTRLHDLPLAAAVQYVAADADVTLRLYEAQQALPADPALVDWECRAVREYCRMAVAGIALNMAHIATQRTQLQALKQTLAQRLAADGLPDPDSPKSRVRYVYQTKGVPLPAWDADNRAFFTWGGYKRLRKAEDKRVTLADLSTRAYVLERYIDEGGPLAAALADLAAYVRTDWTLSILASLEEHAAVDGRVHSLVTIATDTGRRSSSHPAMQNWKMPDMAGVATGDTGFTLVEIDYANAENVMAALISSDNGMAAACRTPDFHSAMAVQYFGDNWHQADDDERKRLRDMSKRISYGTLYGMGARSLGRSLDISTDEARALLRAKDKVFARLARMRKLAERKAAEQGMLKLWSGRPVAVPNSFVAWNYLCQGGVGEMLKRALVSISEQYAAAGMRSRVALDIHDALIIEVAHDEWDAALRLATAAMCNVVPETLRAQTDPPVAWTAEPNLQQNVRKWGKGQYHPTVSVS